MVVIVAALSHLPLACLHTMRCSRAALWHIALVYVAAACYLELGLLACAKPYTDTYVAAC